MKLRNLKKIVATLGSAALLSAVGTAHAAIIISEVDAAGSAGATTYSADWFELTNTGNAAVDITGWRMDDNSNSYNASVALNGVSSIAAGQSVVFIEGDATTAANFKAQWFGANVPVGFTIGYYSGSGVGLSQTADAVNIFDASVNHTIVANVAFGATSLGRTLDNSAGLNNVTISTLSSVGVNGAFTSANGVEIGSPGVVPLPGALPLMASALGLIGGARLRRKQK